MNHIDQLYLQIIYNTCVQNPTDFITIQPEDEQPLTELTKVQSTLPFLLSYIKNPTILNSLKHQTKLMMLNYYQIEQFTRRIADLLEKNWNFLRSTERNQPCRFLPSSRISKTRRCRYLYQRQRNVQSSRRAFACKWLHKG